jgi:hypothetical protein
MVRLLNLLARSTVCHPFFVLITSFQAFLRLPHSHLLSVSRRVTPSAQVVVVDDFD